MKKKLMIIAGAAVAALAFVGCKPTEANYRSAYDAAQNKREEAAAEQMRPATGLLSDDGPQLRVVDGDSIYVQRERLRALDGGLIHANWVIAVGVYKMDTNAKASVSDLKEHRLGNPSVAKASGGRYFALADTAATLETARIKAKMFKAAYPNYPYIGLPGAPVLINN